MRGHTERARRALHQIQANRGRVRGAVTVTKPDGSVRKREEKHGHHSRNNGTE